MRQISSICKTLRSTLTWLVEEKLARTLAGTALSVATGFGLLLLALAVAGRHTGSQVPEYIVMVGLFWVSLGVLGALSHLSGHATSSRRLRKAATDRRGSAPRRRAARP